MKIAIVGSGISGLMAGYHLNKENQISIFEAESWIGGHTHTVKYNHQNLDTGFIVFNDRTYPNFLQMLNYFNVKYQKTQMSFSVRNNLLGFEYNGNNLNSLFSQRKNLFRPKFYKLLFDILKFNKILKSQVFDDKETLSSLIKKYKLGKWFVENYILPMSSAIWSIGTKDVLDFPVQFIAKFFNNHGLLNIFDRPQWFTIKGGSAEYIKSLTKSFSSNIYLNHKVERVFRENNNVRLLVNNQNLYFDKVIFACHSDQVLEMLNNPSIDEVEILSKIKYYNNQVTLHTDSSLLPNKVLTNASWNYLINSNITNKATVTYNLNILQNLNSNTTYCVTLNSNELIDKDKIIFEFNYSHPIYSLDMLKAQAKIKLISGKHNTHFCGAYWNNGFHEDGVVSGLRVCDELGVKVVY